MKIAPTPIGPAHQRSSQCSRRLTKPAYESGLTQRLDIWDPLVECQDDRQTTDGEDANGEYDETPDGKLVRQLRQKVNPRTHRDISVRKVRERNDSSDVNETSAVEEQIDDVRKECVFGSLVEETTGRLLILL